MITTEDLKKMSIKDLKKEIEASKKNLFKVKLDVISGQEKKNNLIKDNKKYIARMNTLMTEKLYKMAYNEEEQITVTNPTN
jgi:ribosomal protein L29